MSFSSIPAAATRAAGATDEAAEFEIEPGTVVDRRTRRWYGVTVFALLALGVGVLTREPGLLLTSAFGIAFAGYGQFTSPPPVEVSVERSISDDAPDTDDTVAVTVTVRNESDRTMPDLRLVDGVPPKMTVVEGSPRVATALRPGQETTFSYSLRARRGRHEFEPTTVLARDASGATERRGTVDAPDTVGCEASLPSQSVAFPLRSQTTRHTGRFPADTGGPGVEFYATREYRPGDPLNRVDWNRTARTGDLTTVQYRVERSVSVVLVVDARQAAYAAPAPQARTALDAAVDAAGHAYVSLTDAGHDVGLTALSPTDCWLSPGNGDEHRVRAREFLSTEPALSPSGPDAETNLYAAVQRIRRRAPTDAQIVVFSPLTNDHVAGAAIRLDANGHRTTVVSPDPTADDSAGHRLAGVRRSLRLADLRQRDIPVVDWDGTEPFPHALARWDGGSR
ncbi:DUF58 domain-containing protein [Halomicrobium sp. LC1Hm]|uniref:DUF58 domain-containing protein n=1 Tax=Halomicrobium sp. LC1Hm TaxID=2610902 RepID=UPI00129857F6|nr:DUF58 domain-containing protein [Halomicrobium sp. LC1Hm]QGA83627.1 putative membrane anchored protein with extracellular vWF domain and Ig-like domain [Halomicrobium sp. LC1Hm]